MTKSAQTSWWREKRFVILIAAGLLLIGATIVIPLLGAAEQPSAAEPDAVIPGASHYPAPSLRLTTLEGETAALSDYLGRVVLVNNWASWCPPCVAELPGLQSYYEAHAGQGFVLIAINAGESAGTVRAFVESHGLTFPVWLDPRTEALFAFQNPSLPNSYVIDREGIVRLNWTGAISLTALEQYVTPLLER